MNKPQQTTVLNQQRHNMYARTEVIDCRPQTGVGQSERKPLSDTRTLVVKEVEQEVI